MDESDSSNQPKEIVFHYVKDNEIKSLHVDGAVGGATSKGKVYLGLFAERNPIPLSVTHEISEFRAPGSAVLGQEIDRTGKQGIVREVLASFIMDPEVAVSIAEWLKNQAALASAEDAK